MGIICNNCGEENFEIDIHCWSCKANLYYNEALPDGTLLQNRYMVEALIKIGGMGAIYRGMDKRLNRYCAIKEMLSTYPDAEQKKYAERRFRVESKLLSWLDHPNLPTVLDYFIEKGHYYLVMSYIDGVDLAEILETQGNPGLREDIVIDWTVQLLDVLDYLHNQNPPIVYRDLKPSNIMLHRDGRIMLIDFGIARTIQPEGKKLKYTSIGTDGYASEEQYRGNVEPRSDIYALGATMHHILTGITPVAFNLKPVRNHAPWVSPALERVIMKALEYEAANRFASAKEMKLALTQTKDKPIAIKQPQKPLRRPSGNIQVAKAKKPVSYNQIVELLDRQDKPEKEDDFNALPSFGEGTQSEDFHSHEEPKTIEYCGDPVVDKNVEIHKPEKQKRSWKPRTGKRDFATKIEIPEKKKSYENKEYTGSDLKILKSERALKSPKRGFKTKIEPKKSLPTRKMEIKKAFEEIKKSSATKKMDKEEILSKGLGGALGGLLQASGEEKEKKNIPDFVKLASIKPENRRTSGELGLGEL